MKKWNKRRKLLYQFIGCIIGLVVVGIGLYKQIDSKRINEERRVAAEKQSQADVDAANARLKEIEKEYYPLKEQYEKKKQVKFIQE